MTDFTILHGGQLRGIADRFEIPASDILDFSANIHPEGSPSAVVSRLRASLGDPAMLIDYPDLDETDLRQSLAQYADVQPENVAVANGFVPLLDAALRVLPIRRCLVPVPAFVEYRRTLERSQAEMIPLAVSGDSDFRYEADDLLSGSQDAVLLANPQNPSGVASSRDMLLTLVKEALARNIYILLDEAFIDYYSEASLSHEVIAFPNLIVFRSVTKFFGMAGLRVAYALANAGLCRRIQEAIAPWSITTLASMAARIAVEDEAYAERTIRLNEDRRNAMRAAMERLGIYVYPSAANFLLLRLPDAVDCRRLWENLIRKHRIVLRHCANYESLSDRHLRAAVRTDTENERLIEALAREIGKI